MANCKVIAVANQKGGVGKSTSVYCIGAGLAMDGKRVLLVDVDPQGDLTKMLGQRKPHELTHTLAEQMNAVVQHSAEPEHLEILHHHEGFDFVPANRSLSAVEVGPTPAAARYMDAGEPSPPAPTMSTLLWSPRPASCPSSSARPPA